MSHPEAMGGPVKREERASVIFDNDFQVFEEVFHRNGDSFSDLLQREELFNCHHHWIPTRCQVWARQLRLSEMGCLMHQGCPVTGTKHQLGEPWTSQGIFIGPEWQGRPDALVALSLEFFHSKRQFCF